MSLIDAHDSAPLKCLAKKITQCKPGPLDLESRSSSNSIL